MFKSIRYKIVIMFVLLTVSIIIVIGTFMTGSVDSFYSREFVDMMGNVFHDEYVDRLRDMASRGESASALYDSVYNYAGQIGVDSFRNCYLLDGATGKAVVGSDPVLAATLEASPNIIAAMRGRLGCEINAGYMDYAVPILNGDTVQYIVYVKDSKEESSTILKNIFSIIMQALLLGLAISVVFGMLLSGTITSPIHSLTQKATKIAAGDFDITIDVRSQDEIGQLTESFNSMAGEIKENLSAIRSEKDKLETILLYMNDGVIAFDSEGRIIHSNPAARRMLRIGGSEQFDRVFEGLEISFAQLGFLEHYKSLEESFERGGTEIKAYFATFQADDHSTGAVVVLQDITKQQKLERARREFVANVSHELRTPITAIKSYAETMLFSLEDSEPDWEQFGSFLGVINDESDRMARLIKDLLLLSRLDNGRLELKCKPFDLAVLIADVTAKLGITAKEKHQTLTYQPTNNLPIFCGDRDRVAQVLINIISNALKYTPEHGEISVTSMHLYDAIYVKIRDNGIGIPEKDLEHIFERFFRVDKARSREMGGTGLGLAISKEIVESHGGTISIVSRVGEGTEVTVRFPCKENLSS